MPKRRTEDAVHVVITDHYIQRQKPGRDLLAEIRESETYSKPAYKGEVRLYYPPAVERTPENELLLAVAQVRERNNLEFGIPRLAALVAKYRPDHAGYYLELGDALFAAGRMAEAIGQYEEAFRRDPGWAVVPRMLASTYIASGKPADARRVLRSAVQTFADDPSLWHILGQAELELGDSADAIAALKRSLELDPEQPEARNSLGTMLAWAGKLKEAESEFVEAVRLNPGFAEPHSNLANVLSWQRDFTGAREHFERALRINPEFLQARLNYAGMLVELKLDSDARRQAEAALRTDADSARAHLIMGIVLARSGDSGAAAVHLRTAEKDSDPNIARKAADALSQLREPAK